MLLGGGIDRDAFTAKDGSEPFRSPGTLTRIVDPRERLQGQALTTFLVMQRAAEILPVAATGNRCRPNRAPKVEGEDLIVGIAAVLHCHQRQQHRLAGAGRPAYIRMGDLAALTGKKER